MPIPVAERKSWGVVFGEEFSNTPAPYFGVNIFDVLTSNWEPVVNNVRQQHEMVKQFGGQSHLWTVRDHGARKRVLWINYYPEQLTGLKEQMPEFCDGPIWTEFCSLIESFQWFCTTEQPSTEP
jgi:hypothetical protein